jgi:hypothetical protein
VVRLVHVLLEMLRVSSHFAWEGLRILKQLGEGEHVVLRHICVEPFVYLGSTLIYVIQTISKVWLLRESTCSLWLFHMFNHILNILLGRSKFFVKGSKRWGHGF